MELLMEARNTTVLMVSKHSRTDAWRTRYTHGTHAKYHDCCTIEVGRYGQRRHKGWNTAVRCA